MERVKKRKQTKFKCVVKRPYRYTEPDSPMRKKGECVLGEKEYEYASLNGFLEGEV